MNDRSQHWNTIFAATSDPELGWYEDDVSQTLKFLDRISVSENATVFLPGAGTSILVDELLTRGYRLILNDISDIALKKLRRRIGTPAGVTWLCHDITRPLPPDTPPAELWIDRAVLHFLLAEADIQGYFANLRATVRVGGHVLLAEFSPDGAPKCAGLELHRYSLEEMTERLGAGYQLLHHESYTYRNPWGDPRPYLYALFRKTTATDPPARNQSVKNT